MRLLRNGDLSFAEFTGNDIPRYAILSHTWEADEEEVTFEDMVDGTGNTKKGYGKIQFCEKQAAKDGLQFFWVDTCCIDKSSSTELAEAINSMFRWYWKAVKCYVHLSDVSVGSFVGDDEFTRRWKAAFKKSRWFTRGWTLQELIAPASVEFFSVEGEQLGDKKSLEQTLHEITGIPNSVLRGAPLSQFSVDERMSWMKERQTKREEDAAYSLLGIFDIHIPLLYGERRQRALNRLMKEIEDDNSVNLPIAKGASFDSHAEEHNARCLRHTRVELLDQIMKWAKNGNDKSIFWLNGIAGTGKSTIARTIAQSFFNQHQLGASFFFKQGEGNRDNATRFFTTIAMDLMSRLWGMRPGIKRAINADPAISGKALKDQFEKLILQPLSEATSLRALELVLVIDGLDECEQDKDIQEILQLLLRTKDLVPVSLRVFVTSRPELHIRLRFKQMPDGTYEDLILHDVAKQKIEHDIRLFLEHELGKIQEQRLLSSNWPRRDQIQSLVELAVPLFIFAATACRYIADRRDNPKRRLNIILQYQYAAHVSKLDRTYLPILSQLFDDEGEVDKRRMTNEFRDIVGSIVVLESSLSISSLAHFLQISKEDIRCRLDSLHSVLSIPDNEELPVGLLHSSFRAFLIDPQKKGKSPFWVDERETHERLVSKCLELLSSSEGLQQNMCKLPKPGTLRSEIDEQTIARSLPPELQYACRYWVHHLEQSRSRIYGGDPVHLFLQKYFLYWLEAMSLIGEAYKCIHMIEKLQALTEPNISAVSSFLHDAARFMLRFQYILGYAPLQIYSSALIFAPEMSIIRRTFADHIPRWVNMISKVENDWDSCGNTLEGYSRSVNAVAFSPDGRLIASASDDCTVRLWETGTGSCHNILRGHSRWVNAVTFSPDGQLVASASGDCTVRLWETETDSCYSTLKGHSRSINTVAFSPDGQLVASASGDCTVRLWETGTGSCHSTLKGHSQGVKAVAFLSDGQLVASASGDCTVQL